MKSYLALVTVTMGNPNGDGVITIPPGEVFITDDTIAFDVGTEIDRVTAATVQAIADAKEAADKAAAEKEAADKAAAEKEAADKAAAEKEAADKAAAEKAKQNKKPGRQPEL
jgi:topoisomerase IA-like protein